MNKIITDKMQDLIELCTIYGVKSMFAFGSSVCTDRFNEKRDIDFLISFHNLSLEQYTLRSSRGRCPADSELYGAICQQGGY